MAKVLTFDEAEAKMLMRECPDKLIEIVKTYKHKPSARAAAQAPQFLILHDNGCLSVAELNERPTSQ